jgi:hypothetical protein
LVRFITGVVVTIVVVLGVILWLDGQPTEAKCVTEGFGNKHMDVSYQKAEQDCKVSALEQAVVSVVNQPNSTPDQFNQYPPKFIWSQDNVNRYLDCAKKWLTNGFIYGKLVDPFDTVSGPLVRQWIKQWEETCQSKNPRPARCV